ncbi:M16 family metallopeptidase [Chryseomicrobium palamuruense]|uniref:M16 family metallopeptidase n=1 Tax=Chryseomicrobium palamuruense TaxID=682973 RepID=A0ABV8UT40_9BACL
MTKHILKNGVRVIVHPMSHTRAVSIGVWIEAGSRHETAEQAGMAHFIEHMLFKGTQTRSAKDLAIAFDRIGGNSNAYTSKEQTCYYTRVLDRYTKEAIDLLADMLWNSVFDEEEMEREKQVIIEEIHMVEDTPDDCVHEYLWEAMYPDHPLGHSILGTKETLASFSRDDVLAFYKDAYHPSRIIVSLAGNIEDDMIPYLEQVFGQVSWEEPQKSVLQPALFHATEVRNTKEVEQAHLTIAWPSSGVKDEQIYATVLLQTMLGGSMSSRLFQEIRETRGLAYSIYSYHTSYIDQGVFAIYGGTSPEQLEELEAAIHESVNHLLETGFTEIELENAKDQIISNIYLSLENSTTWMNRLARNEILYGYQKSIDEYVNRYQQVTLHDIEQVSQLFIQKSAKSLILPS